MKFKSGFKIVFGISFPETEFLADAMIRGGADVKKLYLTAELKDMNSIIYDELSISTSVFIIDSFETAMIAEKGKINNAVFIFIDYNKDENLTKYMITKDFYRIEVKCNDGTKKYDWEKASVLLKAWLSENFDSSSDIRA